MGLASSWYCPAPAVYLDISGVFAPRRNIGACCANAQEGGVSNIKRVSFAIWACSPAVLPYDSFHIL
jgi:hypothetical protein